MMSFAFFLFGGLMGAVSWYYCSTFIIRLQQDVYQNYLEIYGENSPHLYLNQPKMKPQKCGRIEGYILLQGSIFVGLFWWCASPFFALWFALFLSAIFCLALIDWQYRLISPSLCVLLFVLGLYGASEQLTPLSLRESLHNALIFAACFYGIYWLARGYYGREALGQGDYWLMLGLGSVTPLSDFPLMLFIASSSGILVFLCQRKHRSHLPFAPFLCSACLLVLLINLAKFPMMASIT